MADSDRLTSQVEKQLRRSADELGDRLGVELAPAAEQLLQARIVAGARRLVAEGVADDPDSLERAKASLADVLFQSRHGTAPGGERGPTERDLRADGHVVQEDDLRVVFGALCPGLWPFC